MFKESGGEDLSDEQRRLICMVLLRSEIAVHLTMSMIHYPTYALLKASVKNYVRIVIHDRKVGGNHGISLLDAQRMIDEHSGS